MSVEDTVRAQIEQVAIEQRRKLSRLFPELKLLGLRVGLAQLCSHRRQT